MQQNLPRDDQVRLTQSAFRLLGAWSIPNELHASLLGLDPGLRKRDMNRFRLGTPLPTDGDGYRRIILLLRIDNTLHKLFPHSEASANLWATTPDFRLGGHTPLEIMLEKGLEGMERMERVLSDPGGWSPF